MTSVVIADDQEIIRSGLRMVLESQGIDVIGEAANGVEAVEAARRLRPDVVLMDIRMPVVNGIAATVTIVREQLRPLAHSDDPKALTNGVIGRLVARFDEEVVVVPTNQK